MSSTFPSTDTEYEEYVSIMNEMSDHAQSSISDPEPNNFAYMSDYGDNFSDEIMAEIHGY
jgi:hypothetical protein